MSQHRQSLVDGPASSRASIVSVAQLPRRTETGDFNRALPRMPLRVPQKNARRSLPPGGIPPVSPHNLPSPTESTLYPSEPPTPTSPPVSPLKLTAAASSETSELNSPSGSILALQKLADGEKPADDKEWLDHRRRRCRFMLVVGVFMAVVAGLAVGLAVGLSNGNAKYSTPSSSTTTTTTAAAAAVFPAGAYSFDTYLRENSTGCTSRASTWRCYPETGGPGSRATFHWTVQSSGPGPSSYYVSGTGEEPFGPTFANLPATILDADRPTERLTFAFAANATVTPADGGRVANCTYTGVVFRATLWTRRRGGQAFAAPTHQAAYAPWPGDLEVVQYKNSTIGEPVCVDAQGRGVADVQAAGGSCLCRYTSTSLS
ncbi:hypothetical protein ISF_00457 [Cordyceps fumosorosea ARSEF 2679]|uniref:Tat pathway signal sequence n=1 Tax=Cordyceps fumosorosea (strain ARSEF 2679) TaxID=1081104 RepID=A0A168E9W9_CORFA|nr:hypothetical protein ISF_00457 [Cordyceps fumosorosea ARSEF 2679]OAA73556.1 hypothetical protein ISF_00457 [Cordyceps fumosorosea ARSEF 2679]